MGLGYEGPKGDRGFKGERGPPGPPVVSPLGPGNGTLVGPKGDTGESGYPVIIKKLNKTYTRVKLINLILKKTIWLRSDLV